MKKLLLFLVATLVLIGSAMATVTTVVGTTKIYEVSSDRTTTLPLSGNSALYVLEQWNFANNSNYRYVEEKSGKVYYTQATSSSALTEANIVEISNTGTTFTIKFVKTNYYFQNIAADTQATTGASSSNLRIVESPETGGFNIYNADSNTDQLFFTLQNNNYPTGKTGRWAWGTFALYSVTESENYAAYVNENIKPYFDCADTYFGLTSTALSTYESTYNTYKENCTQNEYNTLLNNIRGLYDDPNNYVQPTTGYYRIKSSGARNIGESYLGYGQSVYGTGLRTVAAANKLTDASTVIKLTGSNGTYKISTQGLNVQSQTTANRAFPATGDEGVDFVFSPIAAKAGFVTICNAASVIGDCHGYLHEGGDGTPTKGVVNWQAGAAASQWAVEAAEEFTINLTAANDNTSAAHTYATLCVPFKITGLAGADGKEVKAYAPTKDGNYIVPGDGATTITEGTPVLLIGAEGASSVTATIGSDYANEPATAVLTGTFTGTSIDCTSGTTNYVLGFDEDNGNRIGFYHVNTTVALGANRAYLNTAGSSVKGFAINFDDIVTGVNDVRGKMEDGTREIFNLAGQRMSRVQKGVNIINGKKVLVK